MAEDIKKEMERKFLLRRKPCIPLINGRSILQGYIITEPSELRIRKYDEEYFLTVKESDSFSRAEWEVSIPRYIFEALWPHTEGKRIEKVRYEISFKGFLLELDEYYGRHKGLIIIECEFLNEEIAKKFNLPSWAQGAIEMTNDKRYKNKHLAQYGLPNNLRKIRG